MHMHGVSGWILALCTTKPARRADGGRELGRPNVLPPAGDEAGEVEPGADHGCAGRESDAETWMSVSRQTDMERAERLDSREAALPISLIISS